MPPESPVQIPDIREPSGIFRLFAWYETTRRPGLVLAFVVLLFYSPTLGRGLLLDDLHHFQLMQDYHEGARDTLELYRFLRGDASNKTARERGLYVWWLGDDVTYQHWRPIAERFLYGQFTFFGRSPLGYRIINLLLYITGVLLVYQVFRRVNGSEAAARWGALAFALFACHAIPVTFISAQGDPLSLVLVCLAVLGALEFADTGALFALIAATLSFVLSLGVKEGCLPVAIAPMVIIGLERLRERGGPAGGNALRRAVVVSAIWCAIGVAWLALYVKGGYGSNTAVMLNPASDPVRYLLALPLRSILLLTSLVVPVNPFLFYLRPGSGQWAMYGFAAAGLLILVAVCRRSISALQRERGVMAMALWTVMFLPLLVCTVPDDRVMMLPSVGFALIAGALIARATPPRSGPGLFAKWPLFVFLVIHPATILFVNLVMGVVEEKGNAALASATEQFGRDLRSGDCVFFLNSTLDSNVLFVQSRFEAMTHLRHAYAAFITDIERPVIRRIDDRTLRISSADGCMFDSFLGMMSESRARPKKAGDVLAAREMTGTITKVEGGCVREVEVRFEQSLDSDSYRFFICGELGMPEPWRVQAVGR